MTFNRAAFGRLFFALAMLCAGCDSCRLRPTVEVQGGEPVRVVVAARPPALDERVAIISAQFACAFP